MAYFYGHRRASLFQYQVKTLLFFCFIFFFLINIDISSCAKYYICDHFSCATASRATFAREIQWSLMALKLIRWLRNLNKVLPLLRVLYKIPEILFAITWNYVCLTRNTLAERFVCKLEKKKTRCNIETLQLDNCKAYTFFGQVGTRCLSYY